MAFLSTNSNRLRFILKCFHNYKNQMEVVKRVFLRLLLCTNG